MPNINDSDCYSLEKYIDTLKDYGNVGPSDYSKTLNSNKKVVAKSTLDELDYDE